MFLEVYGDGFTAVQEGAMAAGDLKYGIYYGYSLMKLEFDNVKNEHEEITLN